MYAGYGDHELVSFSSGRNFERSSRLFGGRCRINPSLASGIASTVPWRGSCGGLTFSLKGRQRVLLLLYTPPAVLFELGMF